MKNENSPIYILKGICAILIILIHTDFYLKQIYTPIYRVAVPIFYMISGYYLLNNELLLKQETIKRQLKKIIKYTITASFVYILYNICINIVNYKYSGFQIYWLDILFPHKKYIIDTVILYILSNPYSDHLWYLSAYIGCLICLIGIRKCKSYKLLFAIITICLLLGLFLGKYSFTWYNNSIPTYLHRNFVTTALPFVSIGLCIKRYQKYIFTKLRNTKKILLIFITLNYIEYFIYWKFFPYKEGDFILTTIPTSILIFLFFIEKRSTWGKNNIMKTIGKDYSLNMYLYHMLFFNLFQIIINKNPSSITKQFEFPIILLSTLIALFIYNKITTIQR